MRQLENVHFREKIDSILLYRGSDSYMAMANGDRNSLFVQF